MLVAFISIILLSLQTPKCVCDSPSPNCQCKNTSLGQEACVFMCYNKCSKLNTTDITQCYNRCPCNCDAKCKAVCESYKLGNKCYAQCGCINLPPMQYIGISIT